MTDEEMRELLIRMDERGKRLESKFDDHAETVTKRLDSHASDIKTLRWFSAGLAGALGLFKASLPGGGH